MSHRTQSILAAPLLVCLLLAQSGCVRIAIDALPGDAELTETPVLGDGGHRAEKIALVDVTGLIANERRPGLLVAGEHPVSLLVEQLEKAEHDRSVRAVLLRINSRGGGVAASEMMYREVRGFRERTGKPVIALLMDVAASGGYYVACGADEIIAHPSTVTGSIGVIMQLVDVSDGLRRIGVLPHTLTSGPNKAAGSPFAPLEAPQRALLQSMVDGFYADFVAVVRAARPEIPSEELPRLTDGRVFTGRQALEAGLVDRVGDLRDAFARAVERGGVSRARLVRYHRPAGYVGSAYAGAPAPPRTEINLVNLDVAGLLEPGFYYLWDP